MNENFNKKLREEKNRNQEICLWMSFSSRSGFKGVIITKALGFAHAIQKTHALGINPGGEVQPCPTDPNDYKPEDFDRLLTKEYLIEADYINDAH
jgi:hypothetical protein